MTESDMNDLSYFWTEKCDLERWCYWEERKEAIRKTHPEIVAAWENLKVAKRTMSAVLVAAQDGPFESDAHSGPPA